jgi:hypothetical protein
MRKIASCFAKLAFELVEAETAAVSIDYYAEYEPTALAMVCRCRSRFFLDWCTSDLSLVVWTLKREVRAFGGCLGMHRR